jgi:hypothetical protein
MDPVSIVGLIGSIISIADVVAKSIRKLSELRSRYHNAPFQITTLIGQLYIIQAAINELTRWKSDVLMRDPRYRQLALQLDASLGCFCPIIMSLQQYLDSLDVASASGIDSSTLPGKRISYLWNERDLAVYLGLVDRQVNALNLFLQAIQWYNNRFQIQLKASDSDISAVARGPNSKRKSVRRTARPFCGWREIAVRRYWDLLMARVSSRKTPMLSAFNLILTPSF